MFTKSTIILLSAILVGVVAVDEACTVGSTPGICLLTTDCSSGGGTSTAGFCPNDPTDVECCTKSCGSGGQCMLSSSCSSGLTESGPSNFLCCLPSSSGGSGSSCTSGPAVNSATISLIEQFEGFVASPSPDPIGLPTVGFGHLCQTTDCSEVPFPFPLTVTTATELLHSDLVTFQNCITQDIDVTLNANQYGALVSWAFNVGCGTAGSSTLVALLNEGEDPDTVAAEELPLFDMAGGQVLQGLVNRRAAEVALFKTATSAVGINPC